MLREADANGDGRVSREEFSELLMGAADANPDALSAYDPRLKTHFTHFTVDEDLGPLDPALGLPLADDAADEAALRNSEQW